LCAHVNNKQKVTKIIITTTMDHKHII